MLYINTTKTKLASVYLCYKITAIRQQCSCIVSEDAMPQFYSLKYSMLSRCRHSSTAVTKQ